MKNLKPITYNLNAVCRTRFAVRGLRFATSLLISIFALLYCRTSFAAEATYVAQRDEAINNTVTKLLQGQSSPPILETSIEGVKRETTNIDYLQAEAYYLYTQDRFEEAISRWEEVLALDEENKTAVYYIKEAKAKIDAQNKPYAVVEEEKLGIKSMRQKKLGPARGQYPHTRAGYDEIATNYVPGENRYFDHSISVMRDTQQYAIRTKRETTSFAENIRADTSFGNYNSNFTASWLYETGERDDLRFPRYVNYLLANNNVRFMVGDSSNALSRYVLNGINYRGLNLMVNTDETRYPIDRFNILYGAGKSFDTQSEEYFYPIEVFGARNEIEINPRYKLGTSFAYQAHQDKITRVDPLFTPKKNTVLSFDQYFKPFDWWVLRDEIGYSVTNSNTSDENVPTVEDWAHYITSNILREKWQLYNVYEYGGKNFIGLNGEPRFLHNLVLNDKETFENIFIYTPFDELLFELQYHRTRNNLGKEELKETTKENLLKAMLRIMPRNGLPAIGLKGSILRTNSIPGSLDISDPRYSSDLGMELTKTLYGIDWNAGYTYQHSAEVLNNAFCNFYRNIYSIGGGRSFLNDIIYVNAVYSLADLDILATNGSRTSSAIENRFDASTSWRLWDSLNLSLGYNYFNRRDFTGAFDDLDSHTGSCVLSWPYTKEFVNKQKMIITPYLSYYYTKNDEFTQACRSYFASKLDTDYYLNEDHKINFMLEYKNGVDTSALEQEGDEVRFMASYVSTFGI
ncbi:MAG: hypothetical protein COS99_01590 [Candidatus Omnitrophica bacterium CG07_land_8_20_14_0_80_42_15]|uniref:Uncharacterized protein n=1 Tax=Candidatus Aquitaenariimonas noxiae TaxID=1974741 RepID=A0A2J0L263_9BACT|nr:MAG: hypothetical protein COS99_01590 [Candidatus Omnitrophica bacterium CG07_land_8_20_14_0_80_42_15]